MNRQYHYLPRKRRPGEVLPEERHHIKPVVSTSTHERDSAKRRQAGAAAAAKFFAACGISAEIFQEPPHPAKSRNQVDELAAHLRKGGVA